MLEGGLVRVHERQHSALKDQTPASLASERGTLGVPWSGQIVGGGSQSHFYRHLRQPAQAEAPHAALLLEHSEYRSEDGLAASKDRVPRGHAQFPHHAIMLGFSPAPSPPEAPNAQNSAGHCIGKQLELCSYSIENSKGNCKEEDR